MPQKKRPSQKDVARIAGVSQTTVSHILNDSKDVIIASDTRQRVWDIINEIGYVPNRAARSLRTNKTFTVACVVPDITNPYYPALLTGIQSVLEQHDYVLTFYSTGRTVEKERKHLQSLQQIQVDGMIATLSHISIEDIEMLLDRNVAIGLNQKKVDWDLPIDCTHVDNVAAVCTAVTHLIKRGHTRIAMIGGMRWPTTEPRVLGYRQAFQQHGLPIDEEILLDANFTEPDGYAKMKQLLRMPHPPTAVFAANDVMAIGALRAIKEAGLHIPDDMAVVGFDDIPAARLVNPPLTTIAQFPEQMGKRTAEMLLERLNGTAPPQGRSAVMPYELVVRESCGARAS